MFGLSLHKYGKFKLIALQSVKYILLVILILIKKLKGFRFDSQGSYDAEKTNLFNFLLSFS